MKVKYELEVPEENFDLQLIQHSFKFYSALHDIDDIIRSYFKGYNQEDTAEKIIDKIQEEIRNSEYYSIEG